MTPLRTASAALSVLLLLLTSVHSSASTLFASAFLSFDTGDPSSEPSSVVAVGDLNGDGKLDLAAANSPTKTASVLLGNGDGTFGPRSDFGVGPDPSAIAIADLNRDGKPDLVVVNTTMVEFPVGGSFIDGSVSVLLGNGDGTFGPKTDFETGILPSAVAVGDLDADGKLDLVVASASSRTFFVLRGNGDGTFAPKSDLAEVGGTVAIADLNSDGKLDLVAGGGASCCPVISLVSVLLGNGDGSFGPKTVYEGGGLVSISDMNSDGKLDIVNGTGGNSSTVSVLLGNGDGTFQARTDFPLVTHYLGSIATGDMNGDGAPDVVTDKSILLGRGDGSLRPETTFMTGPGTRSVVIADVNADGKEDVAEGGAAAFVLLGNGDGSFGTKTDFPAGPDPTSLAIAPLNADGNLDLALTGIDFQSLSVLLGHGDGTVGAPTSFATPPNPNQVAAGDLNADGKTDLVTASFGTSVSVFLGNGDGTFASGQDIGSTGGYSLALGDLNADGTVDIAVANPNSSGSTVSVFLGNGDGTFQTRRDFGTGTSTFFVAIADLNGDGRPDLVASNSGSDDVSVLLGNGDGTFGTKADFATGKGPFEVAVRDLNGDGKPDVAIANGVADNVSVLLGNGDGTLGPKTDYATGSGSVAIEDFDGDGKPDLAVANNGLSTVTVLLGNGDGTFGSKLDYGTGASPTSLAIGDMNRDGKPDIVTANNSSQTVTILLNLGPTAVLSARAFVVGDRTVHLGSGPPQWCVQIEPIDQSFALSDVDPSTFKMVSEGTGQIDRISAVVSGASHRIDSDRDGVAEISACFARADLARLFSSIQDRKDVEVTIEGSLATGRRFAAALQLTIKGKQENGRRLAASFAPNPMNPSGVLKLTTSSRGAVTVRLFDLSGRLVRTVVRSQTLEPGEHAFVLDGRDDRGAILATGVYFYRIESPEGVTSGRLAIAK